MKPLNDYVMAPLKISTSTSTVNEFEWLVLKYVDGGDAFRIELGGHVLSQWKFDDKIVCRWLDLPRNWHRINTGLGKFVCEFRPNSPTLIRKVCSDIFFSIFALVSFLPF